MFRNLLSNFFPLFFQLFWDVCSSSSGLHLRLVPSVRFPLLFFSIRFQFSVLFPSILFWYARSSCFPRLFWVSLLCGVAFLRFMMGLRLFFALWSSLLRMRQFGLLLTVFLSDSIGLLSTCSLGLRPSFSASCASGCSWPLTLLLFSSVLRVLLGNPSVVQVLLHCVSAGFLSYSFHRLLLVLVVVFFAPALVISPPGLP